MKYQISKHFCLLILLPTFREWHIYMSKHSYLAPKIIEVNKVYPLICCTNCFLFHAGHDQQKKIEHYINWKMISPPILIHLSMFRTIYLWYYQLPGLRYSKPQEIIEVNKVYIPICCKDWVLILYSSLVKKKNDHCVNWKMNSQLSS